MDRQQIESAVSKRLVENLGCKPEEVTADATLLDLGADSLDGVELVMQLEEDHNIEITDDEGDAVKTVRDAVDLVERKLRG